MLLYISFTLGWLSGITAERKEIVHTREKQGKVIFLYIYYIWWLEEPTFGTIISIIWNTNYNENNFIRIIRLQNGQNTHF